MKVRFAVQQGIAAALIPLLLLGCGSSPDQTELENSSASAQTTPPEPGFFTDLPRFVDVGDIRIIGARENEFDAALDRLNKRYGLIIDSNRNIIKDARILDLGSYDGRWAYAAIDAGAAHVTGIEINKDFVDQAERNMQELGVSPERYNFIVADVLTALKDIEPGTYDGILCAGIFYHITYHVQLMNEFKRLGVNWVIMDSSVVVNDKPIVQWSISPYGLEGTPSTLAIEMIAEQSGFKHEYIPSAQIDSVGMWDYKKGNRVTMVLTPDNT